MCWKKSPPSLSLLIASPIALPSALLLAVLLGFSAHIVLLPAPAWAQQTAGGSLPPRKAIEQDDADEENFDDDFSDDDFDDAGLEATDGPAETGEAEEPFWQLGGFLRLDTSFSYQHEAPEGSEPDYRGLSKLRAAVQLESEFTFSESWKALISGQVFHDFAFELKDRDKFEPAFLDLYEDEAELRETYIQGSLLENLDIKFGRQIVVWGYADQIRVVDVLNPIDNREPGLTDVEDIRLPLTMTRADFFMGDWRLMAVAIHEIRFNKDPVFGSDFFPFPQRLPREEVPENGGENTEYGLALEGIFSGWDLAFYWAQFFDDAAHLEIEFLGKIPVAQHLRHSRLTMTGVAGRIAFGNLLVKSELARFDGLKFSALPDETRSRVDVVVGFEYSGISDTTLGFEAVDRHILDFDEVLELAQDGVPEDVNQYILSYRSDLLNQQLHLVAVFSAFGQQAEQGSLQRYSATYDVFDAFSVTGGVLMIQSAGGENPILQKAQRNDRIFFDAKYSF